MKDVTLRDLENFNDLLWAHTGIPDKYNTSELLTSIARRRRRIKTLKDIYNIDGKARD